MRHGQAELRAQSDSQRALSLSGRLECEKMATYLSRHDVSCDAVLVSPYLRAQQTLETVRPFVAKSASVHTTRFLTPGGSASKTANEIAALQAIGVKSLLIVSHLPLVGYLVEELAPEAGSPAFATASVAHVELDENGFGSLKNLTSISKINNQSTAIDKARCHF